MRVAIKPGYMRKPVEDYIISKYRELEIYHLMKDLPVRLAYKRIANPKTYRSKLKRFQELEQIHSNAELDPFDTLSKEVRNKMSELGSVFTLRKTG